MSNRAKPFTLENYYQDVKAAFSSCRKYILFLTYENIRNTNDHGETLVIITKTPIMKENDSFCRTINKIKTSLAQEPFNSVRTVYLLSLFGIRAETPKDTAVVIKHDGANIAIGTENDPFIKEILASADNVVFAWGASDQIPKKVFDGRMQTLLQFCTSGSNVKYLMNQKSKKHPLHPFFWTKKDPFKLIDIKDFYEI